MTKEELLKPRYRVIADYPGNKNNVGDIITIQAEQTKEAEELVCRWYDKYPAIYERVPWWKDRKVEDMPEYVKFTDKDIVYKISNWGPSIDGWHMKNETDGTGITEGFASIDWHFKKDKCIPATEADYNAYLEIKTMDNDTLR